MHSFALFPGFLRVMCTGDTKDCGCCGSGGPMNAPFGNNRSGIINWSVPRVQFNMRLKCLERNSNAALWTHTHAQLHTCYYTTDQLWHACGQPFIAQHTSYTVVDFCCPRLYGANHGALWEHADNQSFLIPLSMHWFLGLAALADENSAFFWLLDVVYSCQFSIFYV